MGIMDPIVIGEVSMKPAHFTDTNVTIEFDGEGLYDPEGGSPYVAMPVATWEAMQRQARTMATPPQGAPVQVNASEHPFLKQGALGVIAGTMDSMGRLPISFGPGGLIEWLPPTDLTAV